MHNDRYQYAFGAFRLFATIMIYFYMKHDHTLRFTAQLKKKKNGILRLFQLSFQKISLFFPGTLPTILIDTITGSKFFRVHYSEKNQALYRFSFCNTSIFNFSSWSLFFHDYW